MNVAGDDRTRTALGCRRVATRRNTRFSNRMSEEDEAREAATRYLTRARLLGVHGRRHTEF